jgi:hypothetical protein
MNDAIQFQSCVGEDGILNVRVNLGLDEAKKQVIITVAPVSDSGVVRKQAGMTWPEFIEQTYGSCDGLGLERHEQGNFEMREPIA